MLSTLEVELSGQVGAAWFGGGSKTESGRGGSQVGWVLTLIALSFLRHELLLRDQIVYALVKLHL